MRVQLTGGGESDYQVIAADDLDVTGTLVAHDVEVAEDAVTLTLTPLPTPPCIAASTATRRQGQRCTRSQATGVHGDE